jgi:hypothetical protein
VKRYAATMWIFLAATVALLVYAGMHGEWLTFGGCVLGWLFGVGLQQYVTAKRIQGMLVQQISQNPELLQQMIAATQPGRQIPEGWADGVPAVPDSR